jgi:hypothetical protein
MSRSLLLSSMSVPFSPDRISFVENYISIQIVRTPTYSRRKKVGAIHGPSSAPLETSHGRVGDARKGWVASYRSRGAQEDRLRSSRGEDRNFAAVASVRHAPLLWIPVDNPQATAIVPLRLANAKRGSSQCLRSTRSGWEECRWRRNADHGRSLRNLSLSSGLLRRDTAGGNHVPARALIRAANIGKESPWPSLTLSPKPE